MPKNIFQDWSGIPASFDTTTDGTNYGIANHNRVWNPGSLMWVSETQGGGGGGGGAVTVVDGGDVAQGTTTDAAVYGDVNGTLSAKLRGISALEQGIGTANAPATAAVTNVSTTVVAANASRKKMVIMNIGSVNVFFGDGASAVLNSGICLVPNGTWVMDRYTFTKSAINAISASSSTLSIQEYQ